MISIDLPALKDRPSDIPLLAHHFLKKYATEFDKSVTDITPEVLQRLLRHPFNGNVRELENIIERAVALEEGSSISMEVMPPGISEATLSYQLTNLDSDELPPDGINLDGLISDVERRLIEQALQRTGGRKKDAARLLGITFRSFRYRLDKLDM